MNGFARAQMRYDNATPEDNYSDEPDAMQDVLDDPEYDYRDHEEQSGDDIELDPPGYWDEEHDPEY